MYIQKKGLDHKHKVDLSRMGATVISWQVDGRHILFPRQNVVIGGELKMRGRTHWCFPWFGSTKNRWPMKGFFANNSPKAHGFLRDRLMDKPLLGSEVATFSYNNSSGDQAYSHWNYRLVSQTQMLPQGFSHEIEVSRGWDSNTADMPVLLALHSYYNSPNGASINFGHAVVEASGPIKAQLIPITQNYFDITLHGIAVVRMNLNGAFGDLQRSYVVVWSDSDRYVCVEPVVYHPDEFGTPKGINLGKQEKVGAGVEFKLLELH